jgi:hypothetical protein
VCMGKILECMYVCMYVCMCFELWSLRRGQGRRAVRPPSGWNSPHGFPPVQVLHHHREPGHGDSVPWHRHVSIDHDW